VKAGPIYSVKGKVNFNLKADIKAMWKKQFSNHGPEQLHKTCDSTLKFKMKFLRCTLALLTILNFGQQVSYQKSKKSSIRCSSILFQ